MTAMKMFCAAVLLALGSALVPMVLPAPAHADVCGSVGGPRLDVNGCTEIGHDVEIGADVVGAAVVADAADAAAQAAAGRPPCFTRDGVPYYTPGDAPASELEPNTACRPRWIANFPASHPPDRTGPGKE